jgi:type II secretory pathway pseudopilin PulG
MLLTLNLHGARRTSAGTSSRSRERGYVLLTLMLMVALLVIAAAAVLPTVSFELRRDREEELIHRGVQYSRAIRSYYKKFGRYPTRIEELENTNNQRFLRKRYKDPITGKDFKLLHFGEVRLTFGGGPLGGQGINGASPLNNPGGVGSQPGGPTSGGLNSSPGGFGANSTQTVNSPGTQQAGETPDSNSAPQGAGAQQQVQPSGAASKDEGASSPQVFGGGPIVGVISSSKKESIREFNHKKKYSEWQFIYDPGSDRGGLLSTPNQPPLQGFGNQLGQPGQPGNSGNTPFGAPGQGLSNTPNPPAPSGPGTPPTPPTNPPE